MSGVKGRSGTNKGKEKPFADALRMELANAGDDHKALRRIAAKLLTMAEDGDMQAINAIADRIDGKPAQAIIGGDDGDPAIQMLHRIERVIVDPQSPASDSESVPAAT